MGALDGKIALVTGGARGQGAEEGRLFSEAGATVVLADVLDSDGATTAKELGATYAHLDVSSEDEWDQLVAGVVETHGGIDILINNAGIFRGSSLVKETLDQWQQVIAVNQTGVFLGMRAVAKAMIAAERGGAIVNISSVAGLIGQRGATAYSASKWAVRGMTKVAAKELGRHGIRVNSIHPGLIDTVMVSEFPLVVDPEKRDRNLRNTPLGRMGTTTDIANMALFLASDASSYCTGQEFVVDGGIYG
jgi:3alpha(or 20beta)-hydroxysteroid dehydrogenase